MLNEANFLSSLSFATQHKIILCYLYNIACTNYWVTKGTEELQFIVDEDYDEHDVHVSVDEATDMAIEQSTTNQTQYLLKLNEKLREKLTPIFNRKHYSSLPQPTINYFEHRSRKNSYNYSA